jgi:2-iminobutanoate/2-iminopropanoate deaminase
MSERVIRTEKAPTPVGPYNQAIEALGLLFVAGQIPLDPATGEIVGEGDIVRQTERVLANLNGILEEVGAGFENVVKTGVFLSDLKNFEAMNRVYERYFPSGTAPARTCVEVSRLPKDVLVEIDCIAAVPRA